MTEEHTKREMLKRAAEREVFRAGAVRALREMKNNSENLSLGTSQLRKP